MNGEMVDSWIHSLSTYFDTSPEMDEAMKFQIAIIQLEGITQTQWDTQLESLELIVELGTLSSPTSGCITSWDTFFQELREHFYPPGYLQNFLAKWLQLPQVDELTKMVKSLSTDMERMKVEGRQAYKGLQNAKKKGGFRRPNNITSPTVQRERGRDSEDQKIQAPFQNNFMAEEEEGGTNELDPEIHSFGDTPPFPHLTQSAYEESLMDGQLNELSKGDKASGSQGRYDLRSKKRTVAPDVPE
jgi:hypothetical protein